MQCDPPAGALAAARATQPRTFISLQPGSQRPRCGAQETGDTAQGSAFPPPSAIPVASIWARSSMPGRLGQRLFGDSAALAGVFARLANVDVSVRAQPDSSTYYARRFAPSLGLSTRHRRAATLPPSGGHPRRFGHRTIRLNAAGAASCRSDCGVGADISGATRGRPGCCAGRTRSRLKPRARSGRRRW